MADDGKSLVYVDRELAGRKVRERLTDKYFDATAMCKAAKKLFADWRRLETTEALLDVLSASMGIPIDELIQARSGGLQAGGGTWAHPKVAIALAMWCSPEFHVRVIDWVYEGEVKAAATWARVLAELDRRDLAIIQELKAEIIAQRIETVRLVKGATWGMTKDQTTHISRDLTEVGVAVYETQEAIARAHARTIREVGASLNIPFKSGFATKLSNRLRVWCVDKGWPHWRSPETKAYTFPSEAIEKWLETEGRHIIKEKEEIRRAEQKVRDAAAKDARNGQANLFSFPRPAS